MKLNKTLKNIFCLGAIPLCILSIVSCSCSKKPAPTPPEPWPDPEFYYLDATTTSKDVYNYQISPGKTKYFDINFEIMVDHEDFTKKTNFGGELILDKNPYYTYIVWLQNTYFVEQAIKMEYELTCLSKTETIDTYKIRIYDPTNQIEDRWDPYAVYQFDEWSIWCMTYFRAVGDQYLTREYHVRLKNIGGVKIYK